jgi:hypothetical protein
VQAFHPSTIRVKATIPSMKIITPILCVLLLVSCVGPPTQQELAAAVTATGYGEPLTIDWQAAIKQWFFTTLKDPLSAQYVFSQPVKGAARVITPNGSKVVPGYRVIVQVNGKNSYGAYVGFRQYSFMFRDNRIISVDQPIEELTE